MLEYVQNINETKVIDMSKRGEYEVIYDFEDDDSRNYEELDENESVEDAVERIKNSYGRGDCMFCGTVNGMIRENTMCLICESCGRAVHEDIYFRWLAGYDVEFED